MVEAGIDVCVDVFCVEFFYKDNPVEPRCFGIGKKISVFRKEEIALVS